MLSTAVISAVGSPVAVFFRLGTLQVGVIAPIHRPALFQGFATSFRYLDFGSRPSLQIRPQI